MVSLVFQQQESVESELIENVFTGSNSSHSHGHSEVMVRTPSIICRESFVSLKWFQTV